MCVVAMQRRRRQAQPFRAARHRRIVDRLDVDRMAVEQKVARLLAQGGVAHEHRHDVRGRGHDRQAGHGEPALQRLGALLMAHAKIGVGADMAHAGQRRRGDGGRQRRGEDEARAAGAHEVDGGRGRGDIAADHAERLGERALHDIDLVERAVALGHARAARAVHADGMDLVEIGERAVAVRDVADLADRRDVAVHRVDRFEGHDLGRRRIGAGQQLLEMGHVVVAEDAAHGAGVADAGDHRGVVQRVGIELAAWQKAAQRLQRGLVGDIARGEDEGRFLVVQPRELALELRRAACWCRRCCACRRRPSPGRRSPCASRRRRRGAGPWRDSRCCTTR